MMPSSGARRCIFGFPPPLHRTNVECILVLGRLVVARDCAEKQLPYMIVWVFIAVYSREYLPAFPHARTTPIGDVHARVSTGLVRTTVRGGHIVLWPVLTPITLCRHAQSGSGHLLIEVRPPV